MKTNLIVILAGFFLSASWIGYLGFGWLSFNAGSEVMVDGITISAVIVTVLSVVFSILSWFLFSWATKNINSKGMMISVITGFVLITPFAGILGPMAAVLVGLVAGFAASYVILFAIVISVQPTAIDM